MKKINVAILLMVTAMFGFTSCSDNKTASLSEGDKAEISKAITDINQAFNDTKDYKAYVNAYYAEDATVLYPNREAVKGRDAIMAMFSGYGTDINVTPTVLEINGRGDLAYVYGTVIMETNTRAELDHGKYIEIWKKQEDGKWQVIYDIFNTSVPAVTDTTAKIQ